VYIVVQDSEFLSRRANHDLVDVDALRLLNGISNRAGINEIGIQRVDGLGGIIYRRWC
jgi:hypothetical protein